MIARTWRGATRAADAEAYAEYIQATGIAAYAATPGNRGAYLLYRIEGDRAEFLTVSLWESLAAIEAFAGADIERAVFYPEDDRYLVERELVARHYVVAATAEPPAG
jgi:heme-degrading monooxygenase HmoA